MVGRQVSLGARLLVSLQVSTAVKTRNGPFWWSLASNRLSRCGLVRGWPVLSSHFSFGAAPHVGQETASICLGLGFFVMPKQIVPQHPCMGMVNFDQLLEFIFRRL